MFGIEGEKIKVVYPGFNAIGKLTSAPIAVPEKFFLFVGVIKERKNVFNVVKAFEIFQPKNFGTHLVIAGKKSGVYYEEVEAYVRERGLTGSVHFIGFVTDNELSFLYQKAVALVFPSIVEGFGFPILEAMGAGLPVITSRGSSLGEIAGNAALTVVPEHVEEIAGAMQKISTDGNLRAQLITLGKKRSADFDWNKCARETLKIITELPQ